MVNEVSNVVVLNIGIGADIQTNKLWCSVALQAASGSGTNAKLLIDTGSAVSIIPHCFYKDYFKDIALNNLLCALLHTQKSQYLCWVVSLWM